MTICEYCKNKNMSKEEYKQFKNNIVNTAKTIKSNLKYCGGMYYPVTDLFYYNSNADIKHFIIAELKKLDIEFINNNTLYRVCS